MLYILYIRSGTLLLRAQPQARDWGTSTSSLLPVVLEVARRQPQELGVILHDEVCEWTRAVLFPASQNSRIIARTMRGLGEIVRVFFFFCVTFSLSLPTCAQHDYDRPVASAALTRWYTVSANDKHVRQ